jgi:crossover junction endodeoxyribonuclease RuvC
MTKVSHFIGVDPGASGAFAVWNPHVSVLHVFSMVTVAGSVRGREILWGPACDWLDEHAPTWMSTHAVVEQVGARPKQGASSGFKFGRSAGAVQGILAQRRTPVTFVVPTVWKQHFKLIGRDKSASRARACELFPWCASLFARVKDDGVAEAALLARYGAEIMGGL